MLVVTIRHYILCFKLYKDHSICLKDAWIQTYGIYMYIKYSYKYIYDKMFETEALTSIKFPKIKFTKT